MRLQLDSASTGPGERIGSAGVSGGANVGSSGSAAPRDASSAGGLQDSSSVSGTSTLLNNLSSERAVRVQQLTSLVQGGTYQISSAAVSQALVGQAIS